MVGSFIFNFTIRKILKVFPFEFIIQIA
ncbi:hypothetical protein YPPY58_2383, partial [Yersinia pestis PY-58]